MSELCEQRLHKTAVTLHALAPPWKEQPHIKLWWINDKCPLLMITSALDPLVQGACLTCCMHWSADFEMGNKTAGTHTAQTLEMPWDERNRWTAEQAPLQTLSKSGLIFLTRLKSRPPEIPGTPLWEAPPRLRNYDLCQKLCIIVDTICYSRSA